MKLYVFDCGRAELSDMSHLTPGRNVGKKIVIPVLSFLIDHPKGLVVFDTGVDVDEGRDALLKARADQRIDRQISRAGYDPGAVKYVVMSHLHLDHAGCMHLFPHSTFIVRREELRAAWWPDAYEHGYDFSGLLKTRHLKYLQPRGGEAFDIFQDGSVVCIDTKGHTEGHQSLVVDLPRSGKVVLAGDAAQLLESFTDKVPPGLCWNSQCAVESIEMLQHLQAQGALVILGHEPSDLGVLRFAPDCYE
jgi:glyoxylase-like metal-dependent hydrolase (beta-lactamase superfamily II)